MIPAFMSVMFLCLGISRSLGIEQRWRWVVFGLLFSSTAVTVYVYGGKTDIFAAGVGLAAIHWLLIDQKSLKTRHCIAAGIFTGMAPLFKFTYLLGFLPVTAGLMGWWLYRERSTGFALAWNKSTLFFTCVFATLFLGWNLKNIVWAGEPFAPLFAFDNVRVIGLDRKYYADEAETYLRLIFPSALFFGKFSRSQQHLSPLLFGMAPFLYYSVKRAFEKRAFTKDLGLLAACCFALAMWTALRPQIILPRHFMATCIALIIPVVYAVQTYFNRHKEKPMEYLIILLAVGLLVLNGAPLRFRLIYFTLPYFLFASDVSQYRVALPKIKMVGVINHDERKPKTIYSAGFITEPLNGAELNAMRYLFVNREPPRPGAPPLGETPAEFWRRMVDEQVDYIMVSMWSQGNAWKRMFSPNAIPSDVDVNTIEFGKGFILYKFGNGQTP